MKKIITAVFLIITATGFSQQLTYRTGGNVYNAENKKINPMEVRALIANNNEALSLYNAGRNKKTWGNVLLYGGSALVVANLLVGLTKDEKYVTTYPGNGYYPSVQAERTSFTAAIIGGAMILGSIPVKIGYTRKVKSALTKYNDGLAENNQPAYKTTLVASSNQIGIKIEF
nr:hypothetical protein [uncultured Flavobacterium sp.]